MRLKGLIAKQKNPLHVRKDTTLTYWLESPYRVMRQNMYPAVGAVWPSDETKLVFKMLLNTAEECRKVKSFAVNKNEENFDKLEKELEKMILDTV